MIPQTEITNPLYNPNNPSDLKILIRQFPSPENSLYYPFPISAANLVRAKSRGYTNKSEVAPAAPPEANDPKK